MRWEKLDTIMTDGPIGRQLRLFDDPYIVSSGPHITLILVSWTFTTPSLRSLPILNQVFFSDTCTMRFIPFFAAFGTVNAVIDVQLVWRLEKDSGHCSVSALDPKKGTLLAGSCGSTLEADTPIDFSDVDKDGNGNFTVGDLTYRVHSKPEFSGGPSCSKTFNAKYSLVQCSGVEWPGTPDSAKGNATDCFKDAESQATFRALGARGLSQELHSVHRRDMHQNDERQFCSWYTTTNLVDDGTFVVSTPTGL